MFGSIIQTYFGYRSVVELVYWQIMLTCCGECEEFNFRMCNCFSFFWDNQRSSIRIHLRDNRMECRRRCTETDKLKLISLGAVVSSSQKPTRTDGKWCISFVPSTYFQWRVAFYLRPFRKEFILTFSVDGFLRDAK